MELVNKKIEFKKGINDFIGQYMHLKKMDEMENW